MPTFLCKIGTSDGRVLEKEFEAANRDLLRNSLEEQGFFVFQINRRPFQFLTPKTASYGRLSSRKFLSFNQELLVLLRAGLPILQVLDAVTERMEKGSFYNVLRDIRDDIKGGSSLSEAFGKFPRFFPNLYVASIKAGERTGDLPVTLSRYLAYLKRVEKIKAKVKSASFYPVILTVAVVAVLLFLMLYVVPQFVAIYADAKVTLPLITRLVIGTANFTGKIFPILVPLLFAGGFVIRLFLRTERGGLLLDKIKLKIPFFNRLILDYSLLGFCRTFGTTLASGIPVVPAMQMSRGTLNNRILESKVSQAILRIQEGATISTSLEQTGYFPVLAVRMISVGESSGSLADMLNDVSDFYEEEVERRLERMTTLIEPVMMASMGLLIGGIVVAMYIPIFQLAGTVN